MITWASASRGGSTHDNYVVCRKGGCLLDSEYATERLGIQSSLAFSKKAAWIPQTRPHASFTPQKAPRESKSYADAACPRNGRRGDTKNVLSEYVQIKLTCGTVNRGTWHTLHLRSAILSHEEEVDQGLQNELVVPVLKNFLSLPLIFRPNQETREYGRLGDISQTKLRKRRKFPKWKHNSYQLQRL